MTFDVFQKACVHDRHGTKVAVSMGEAAKMCVFKVSQVDFHVVVLAGCGTY